MAQPMSRVYNTQNAYEFSETVVSEVGAVIGTENWIPANVGQVTCGIKQTVGSGGYKVQVSFSTRQEVEDGIGVWFDWEIPGKDAGGFVTDTESQFWMPVPSHMRLVLAAGVGTTVYFSARAN